MLNGITWSQTSAMSGAWLADMAPILGVVVAVVLSFLFAGVLVGALNQAAERAAVARAAKAGNEGAGVSGSGGAASGGGGFGARFKGVVERKRSGGFINPNLGIKGENRRLYAAFLSDLESTRKGPDK